MNVTTTNAVVTTHNHTMQDVPWPAARAFPFGGKSMTAIAAITKEKRCPICQRQFVRGRRSNRFRQSGRPNEEHIYCSSRCRQKAYRRRVRADRAVTQDRAAGPIEPQNNEVHSAVAH